MTNLVVFNPANINIPTKKLNSVQLKQYQEYAAQLVHEIEKYIREIKQDKISTFESTNRQLLEDEYIKKNKLDKIADKLNGMIKLLFAHNQLVTARKAKFVKEREDLETKYNADLAELKVAGNKLYDSAKKVYESLDKDEENLPYQLENIGSYYAISNDNSTYNLSGHSVAMYGDDLERILVKAKRFIDTDKVREELKKRVKPLVAEWEEKSQAIDDLKVSAKEILMFDETKINQVFEQLVSFRNAVKIEWRKIYNKESEQ